MYTWVANTRLNHSLCFGSPSPEEVVREAVLALLVVVCKPVRCFRFFVCVLAEELKALEAELVVVVEEHVVGPAAVPDGASMLSMSGGGKAAEVGET